MNFTRHSNLIGQHSFLAPSSPAWTNYDEDKLDRVFHTRVAAQRGTDLHDLAQRLIRLGVRLPDNGATLNSYVNDAIGFKMRPEQPLFYSENCFGTVDAIGYRNEFVRIHDLKTGVTESSMRQLEVYFALFCLEYRFKPNQVKAELRIYQNDSVRVHEPEPDDIFHIIDKIVVFDKRLKVLREEVPF